MTHSNRNADWLYLLDADVLIRAKNTYYQLNRVPEFWNWLSDNALAGSIKIPRQIFEEIAVHPVDQRDDLEEWVREREGYLVLNEEVNTDLLNRVLEEGYGPDLTDEELLKVRMDPFLISYALADPARRMVITMENSEPSKQRSNRKIPDVCEDLQVRCGDTFHLIRALDFSTGGGLRP